MYKDREQPFKLFLRIKPLAVKSRVLKISKRKSHNASINVCRFIADRKWRLSFEKMTSVDKKGGSKFIYTWHIIENIRFHVKLNWTLKSLTDRCLWMHQLVCTDIMFSESGQLFHIYRAMLRNLHSDINISFHFPCLSKARHVKKIYDTFWASSFSIAQYVTGFIVLQL